MQLCYENFSKLGRWVSFSIPAVVVGLLCFLGKLVNLGIKYWRIAQLPIFSKLFKFSIFCATLAINLVRL